MCQSKCEGYGESIINKVDELKDMNVKHQGQSKAFYTKVFFILILFHYFLIPSTAKVSNWSIVSECLKALQKYKPSRNYFHKSREKLKIYFERR